MGYLQVFELALVFGDGSLSGLGNEVAHLDEIARMTPAYARSHGLTPVLIPALVGMADTAGRLTELLAAYDERVALLKPSAGGRGPDLTPQPGLASAGLDGPSARPPVTKLGRLSLSHSSTPRAEETTALIPASWAAVPR